MAEVGGVGRYTPKTPLEKLFTGNRAYTASTKWHNSAIGLLLLAAQAAMREVAHQEEEEVMRFITRQKHAGCHLSPSQSHTAPKVDHYLPHFQSDNSTGRSESRMSLNPCFTGF